MTKKELNAFIGQVEICLKDLKKIEQIADETGSDIESIAVPGRHGDWRIDCVADILGSVSYDMEAALSGIGA